jgi:hypothetical protein
MCRTLWDVDEIPSELRQYFEEVETECGAPWVRVVERTNEVDASAKGSRFDKGKTGINGNGRTQEGERYVKRVAGWRPSCNCPPADPVPAVVLDPFAGSGTTGRVANQHNRRFVGVDISQTYLEELAPARLEVQPYLLGADIAAT